MKDRGLQGPGDKGAAQLSRKDKGRRCLLKNKSAGISLFWQHGIFHSLTDSKLQRGFRGNLNGFAGRRIATFAGFTLGFHEFSKSGKNKFAIRLHFARGERGQFFEELLHLGSLHAGGFGKVVNNFGLGHALLACSGFGRHSLV